MLAIAFWNVNDNAAATVHIEQLLNNLSTGAALEGHTGDVLLCIGEPANVDVTQILKNLNGGKPGPWWAQEVTSRFVVFGNFGKKTVRLEKQVLGCLPVKVKRLTGTTPVDYRIWFVHLTAPIRTAHKDIFTGYAAGELRREIEEREDKSSIVQTIVIGDFNMPPYGPAMTAPQGLNAVACKKIANKGTRTVLEVEYQYFFNPMWRLLGCQTTTNQPGSFYFYDQADSTCWQMWDQVIVRPCLMDALADKSPCILTSTGADSLLSDDGYIKTGISDHLPVAASLSI